MSEQLSIAEIMNRCQQLAHEACQDAQAVQTGQLDQATAIQRRVHREMEQRWLEMESLLLDGEGKLQNFGSGNIVNKYS